MESHFLQIHEVKMGGHHTCFGAIMVQRYGKGDGNIHFKMHVSNVLSAR